MCAGMFQALQRLFFCGIAEYELYGSDLLS